MIEEIKPIAFYLPQFHEIPENDKAHGKGFTEWTNVKKATPLFEGHNQPRVPLNDNYYNLLDPKVMAAQAKIAKEYGIYGFCYYHYWFSGGKKLLERPIEMMLENKDIEMPFCLCWANENWTNRWDGGNNEIIVQQDYGDDMDLYKHIDYLCGFFKDERYITIDGMPLFIIYKPDIIPNIKHVVKLIRKRTEQNGLPGIKIAVQYPQYYYEGAMLNLFDYYIQFQPAFSNIFFEGGQKKGLKYYIKRILRSMGITNYTEYLRLTRKKGDKPQLRIRNYNEEWENIIKYEVKDERLIAGAFVDWDNTPRTKTGIVYKGASPRLFEKYLKQLLEKIKREYKSEYLFINAWNEWAEGCYLEPDEKNKYAYLEALKKSLNDVIE